MSCGKVHAPLRTKMSGLIRRFVQAGILFSAAFLSLTAEPIGEIRSFSAFPDLDLAALQNGDIAAAKGDLMQFRRGIFVQTAYVVQGTPEHTIALLKHWNPTPHHELEVSVHSLIQTPVDPTDFSSLKINPDKSADRWLIDKTSGSPADLQLTAAERKTLAQLFASGGDPVAKSTQAWKSLLQNRASAFESGWSQVVGYDLPDGSLAPRSEIRQMLDEQSAVRKQFGTLLQKSGLLGGEKSELVPEMYWELFPVSGHSTFDLGATFALSQGSGGQVADCQYYVSNGYYASLILYQVWPCGKNTLVWRGDFLSAPSLAITRGIERMAYGSIMLQEIKTAIRAFQQDAAHL